MQSSISVLLNKQDGGPLTPNLVNGLKDRVNDKWSKTKRRFIKQQQPGTRHKGTCHRQHLLLTPRQSACLLLLTFFEAWKECEPAFHIIRNAFFVLSDKGTHLQIFTY